MKPQHLAKITSNARALVCRHRHLAWRLSLGDLEQEALLAQVDAATRFDEERGTPFGAYTWKAGVIASQRFTLTESAPVSGRHDPRVLVGLHRTEFLETDHFAEQQSPEEEVSRAEWAQQVRERLAEVVGESGVLFATQMLTGEFKPADVVEEYGVKIGDVYKAVKDAKDTIAGDPVLFELWRSM